MPSSRAAKVHERHVQLVCISLQGRQIGSIHVLRERIRHLVHSNTRLQTHAHCIVPASLNVRRFLPDQPSPRGQKTQLSSLHAPMLTSQLPFPQRPRKRLIEKCRQVVIIGVQSFDQTENDGIDLRDQVLKRFAILMRIQQPWLARIRQVLVPL